MPGSSTDLDRLRQLEAAGIPLPAEYQTARWFSWLWDGRRLARASGPHRTLGEARAGLGKELARRGVVPARGQCCYTSGPSAPSGPPAE